MRSTHADRLETEECNNFMLNLPISVSNINGRTPLLLAVAFVVAGGGFEPPTFGLCDLTHLSMRVGLYLHPRGVLAIQSLRLPPASGGLVRYCLIARAP